MIKPGDVYGNLRVIEATNQRYKRRIVWKCLCKCGNYTYAVGDELQLGRRKSCGCLSRNHSCGKSFEKFYEKGTNKSPALVVKLSEIAKECDYNAELIGNYVLEYIGRNRV